MSPMTIPLSEENRSFVEAQSVAEGYESPGAFVDAVIRDARLASSKKRLDEILRRTLREPATEMTQADWDELRRGVIERSPELRSEA